MKNATWESWFKVIACKRCRGIGINNDRSNRCPVCKGDGLDKNLQPMSLQIPEEVYFELAKFNHQSQKGEAWLAFVDWFDIIDLERLLADGWVEAEKDLAPVHENYRDDFPETLYTISAKGRIALAAPGRYIIEREYWQTLKG